MFIKWPGSWMLPRFRMATKRHRIPWNTVSSNRAREVSSILSHHVDGARPGRELGFSIHITHVIESWRLGPVTSLVAVHVEGNIFFLFFFFARCSVNR